MAIHNTLLWQTDGGFLPCTQPINWLYVETEMERNGSEHRFAMLKTISFYKPFRMD